MFHPYGGGVDSVEIKGVRLQRSIVEFDGSLVIEANLKIKLTRTRERRIIFPGDQGVFVSAAGHAIGIATNPKQPGAKRCTGEVGPERRHQTMVIGIRVGEGTRFGKARLLTGQRSSR